jgi:hypothetical protein
VSPRTLELLRDYSPNCEQARRSIERTRLTTLERLVLFRDFDDPRSVPHDGNFASRAKICLARFVRLPTRDATLAAEPTVHQVSYRLDRWSLNQDDSDTHDL